MNIQSFKNNLEIQRPVSSSQGYSLSRSPKKSRRFRSAFTTEQIMYLEKEFKKCPYVANTSRREISNALNISERAIKIWFQNRRMKGKKEASRDVNNANKTKITFNLTNDQLNNVNNLQSTNDEARITTSLKSTNEDANVNHGITKDFVTSRKQISQHEITTTSTDNSPTNLSKPFEDYRRRANQINTGTALDTNKGINQQYYSGTHELPQDLSQRSKANVSDGNLNPSVSNDPGCTSKYFQNCYTPPCIPGNVLWKPFNMNSTLAAVTAVNNPYNPDNFPVFNPQYYRKSNCQCDCHMLTPHVIQDPNQTQYIPLITIPYTRPDML